MTEERRSSNKPKGDLKFAQRLSVIAAQTIAISKQLVRDPANAQLVPHVEEIHRLKSAKRRKKAAPAPETPAPQTPAPAPQHA